MLVYGLTDSTAQPGYTIGWIQIEYSPFAATTLPQRFPIYESVLKLLLPQAPEYFLAHIKHLKLGSSRVLHHPVEDFIHADITHLCQWLRTPTCQLETLSLSDLQPDHIEMVSKAISEISSLTTLTLDSPEFTLQSMMVFASMLQESHSLTEVTIDSLRIDDDCVCCLAEAVHTNTILRKLNIILFSQVGQRGEEALQELHKHSTARELIIYCSKLIV